MGFKIVSIETAFPKKFEYLNKPILKNQKINKINKIINTTGINKRYISSPNEDVISLSVTSAKKTLKKVDKNKIGFIIFVTQTSPYKLPTAACIMQNELGLPENVFATDINLGCSGFVYALKLTESLINLYPDKDFGLIICSDTYTKYIKKNNQSCRSIFSDASATIAVKRTKKKYTGPFNFGSDGSGYKDLILHNKSDNIFMNGAKIAIFTLKKIPNFINTYINKEGINIKKIKLIALHQASKYICDNIKKKLNINKKIFFNNYMEIGNTVSASIPILLKSAARKRLIKENDEIIACGFGVGLSWGITKIKWAKLQ
jgi:3-oxoacyl-[acyl-carrier-protein] synthase-3